MSSENTVSTEEIEEMLPVKSQRTGDRGARGKGRAGLYGGIALALLVLAVAGAFFLLQNTGAAIDTAKVEPGDLSVTVLASGVVTSGMSRDVYPETQGLIKAVKVKDGEYVQKGDVLATIDDGATLAQLLQARAALASARSGLAQAQAGGASASAGLAAAKSSLTAAKAALTSAKNSKSLSQQVLKNAQAAVALYESSGAALTDPSGYAQAKAAVTQAQLAVEQATAGVAQASAGVAQAKAAVKQAESAKPGAAIEAAKSGVAAADEGVALAEAAMDATIIKAPISGMVLFAPTPVSAAAAASGIKPTSGAELMQGSAVTPGSPVFTIVNNDALSFTVEVDEADVTMMAVGQAATVTLSSFSGEEFLATVSRVSSVAKPTMTGGTVFEVELTFDVANTDMRLGMKGDAVLEIETKQAVLTIPLDGWFSEGGKDFVYVVAADNTLKKTTVTIGASTERVAEVIDGLNGGDTIAIASGAISFSDGMRVRAR